MKSKKFYILKFIFLLNLFIPALIIAQETEAVQEVTPGYRPRSELDIEFIKKVEGSKVTVFPTIIRTIDTTTYSQTAQKRVVSFLNKEKIITAIADATIIAPGELKGPGQYNFFMNDMKNIADEITSKDLAADYNMILEVLIVPNKSGGYFVFGIHWFILDRQGENAFSFLLNSHHELFSEAKLLTADSTKSAYDSLIYKSTEVALTALSMQISDARNPRGNHAVSLLLDDAIKLKESGKREEALAITEKVLDMRPDNYVALTMKAYILARLGKYDDALNAINKVIKLNPEVADAVFNRACIHNINGNESKALTDLEKAVKLDKSIKERAKQDEDLKSLWEKEEFKKLTE